MPVCSIESGVAISAYRRLSALLAQVGRGERTSSHGLMLTTQRPNINRNAINLKRLFPQHTTATQPEKDLHYVSRGLCDVQTFFIS
jgi:hypothetical protein